MVRYGPWVTPPEQVDARVDRDGSILTSVFNLLAIDPSDMFVGRSDHAFQGSFNADEPTDAEAVELVSTLASGVPSEHISFDHSASAFLEARIHPPGSAPHQEVSWTTGGMVRFVPTPVNYLPPEYFTDPHVIGIEYDGDNVITDRWLALCAWFDDNSSYDGNLAGVHLSDDTDGLLLDWMRYSIPEQYDYTGGFTAHPGNSGPLGAYLATDQPAPSLANALGADPGNPLGSTALPPVISVVDLDPLWIDTRGNVGIGVEPNVIRVGFLAVWAWVPTIVDRRKAFSIETRAWPGIRYQPADYRLVYDQAAPLRQYPRDDGLVGTSVARQASTATSRQASIRQSGYL